MPRKQPTIPTIKKLFALSGNCCAFPDCTAEIVDSSGSIIGQICHIEAAEPGGERYNPNQTDDERASFENLVLLCANDHIKTNDVIKYDVPILQKMKREHEKNYKNKKYNPSVSILANFIINYQKTYIQNNSIVNGNQINISAENLYLSKETEQQEISIIQDIFIHVNNKIMEGVGKDYKPDPSINLIDKIKLNFKSIQEQEEVNQYFTYAFLKMDLIHKRFQILDPEQQKDIHAHLLREYHILKRNNETNINILTRLFNEFVPEGKKSNSRYISLSMAFVLYFFDDCTIFEKTEAEMQIKLNLD